MKMNKKKGIFKRYLSNEIVIDFKTCAYFFCIFFFYCMYLICGGVFEASVVYLLEILAATYVVSYFQIYLLNNFDEADKLGGKELLSILVCSLLYTFISYILGWFDKGILATGVFFLYMWVIYGSIFGANKIKRKLDTENLNKMLTEFKSAKRSSEETRVKK